MRDLQNRDDLLFFVEKFYEKLLPDPLVGHFFTEVMELDLQAHLPILADFWDNILFGGTNYHRNPMAIHLDLHKKSALEQAHFERWLEHFNQTLSEHFEGPNATLASQRAQSIAIVMQSKIYAHKKSLL